MISTEEPIRVAGDCSLVVDEIEWPSDIGGCFRRFAALPATLFLDSARFDALLARYSYLTADPFETIRSRAGLVQVTEADGPVIETAGDPIQVLGQRLGRWSLKSVPGLPPFQGGAAGLFSYDLCHFIERLPRPRCDEFEVPDLAVGLYDWVLAFDHLAERAWIISTGLPELDPDHRGVRAHERSEQVQAWLREPVGTEDAGSGAAVERAARRSRVGGRASVIGSVPELTEQWPVSGLAGLSSTFSRTGYLNAVRRAIEYIHSGDVYQVNLAQRLLFPLTESPVELYLRLREYNPAPFAGYFDTCDFIIASASPELFLSLHEGEVQTRPIKGTRPRWPVPEADMYSAGELQESDKDRAENVMIVDLLRNDLGRVCEYGSVHVPRPLRLESYEFVHHLVSEVRGRLRRGLGPIDLLRAAFPGGSVTGAPKIRAMEIIAELEPTARGAYCGSLGYIGFNGAMDTNILIRTFTCGHGWIQFPVGGGIVAQSVPELEYEETLHKAEGMIRALA